MTDLIDTDGQPLTFRRGTSPTLTFAVKDDDGNPKNLNGATEVTFAIAADRSAAKRDLELKLNDGVSHDGPGGNVTVAFTAQQTEDLPVGRRWCELWITDAQGTRAIVAEGIAVVHDTLVTVP